MDKGRILVVDDETGILNSLEGILHDEGYRVLKANSGERALDLVRAEAPDVILVDVWMPGIDGIRTLQAVKESGAHSEVIVMSGHGNIETAVAATKLGAFDFIEKPLSMETVLRVVGSAVQAHRAREGRTAESAGPFLDSADPKVAALRAVFDEAAGDLRPLVLVSERGGGKRHAAQALHRRGVTREGPFTVAHARSLCGSGKKTAVRDALKRLLPEAGGGSIYLDGAEQCDPAEIPDILALLVRKRPGDRLVVPVDLPRGGAAEDLAGPIARKIGARLLHLPPLRERRDDIVPLVRRFLAEAAGTGPAKEFSEEALDLMYHYDWPGNVAELKGAVSRAVFATPDPTIRPDHLPALMRGEPCAGSEAEAPADFKSARRDWERRFLVYHIVRHDWDTEATARAIGMAPSTLARMLRTHRLAPPAARGKSPGAARQRTISRSVVLYGRGLHSGLKTGLILEPLPPDSGIRFGSLTTEETVAARAEFVDNTNYATNLRHGAVVARTIEHLMSALHAYGVSNLLVKIGEEVPVMDGSALEFCQLIEEAGLTEQGGGGAPLVIDKPYRVGEPGSEEGSILIEPHEGFHISYHLDYPAPVGVQSFEYRHAGPEIFKAEIAPARTFSFISTLESLEEMGLGEGGRWGNIILVDNERVVNTELRFPDEFVRHKILDLIGDLYLLGRPIRGRVRAERSGHRLNVEMVRLLTKALL